MNSSISSIQSENKQRNPPIDYKKPSKLSEDIEFYVKSQTQKTEKELIGE